jgi:hypothetical protein
LLLRGTAANLPLVVSEEIDVGFIVHAAAAGKCLRLLRVGPAGLRRYDWSFRTLV